MSYQITDYTLKQAEKYGVSVTPSKRREKKIDVFKDGKRIATVGANKYKDYPTYIKERGQEYADERRALFKKRFARYINKEGTNAWWANVLLW
jgi:hypothetical protein